jgi:hypothetical protein
MEIRWLGEVELTFNPSFLPFPCPYIHGKKTPRGHDLLQISHSVSKSRRSCRGTLG